MAIPTTAITARSVILLRFLALIWVHLQEVVVQADAESRVASSVASDDPTANLGAIHDLHQQQDISSSQLPVLRNVSPECWSGAMTVLHRPHPTQTTSTTTTLGSSLCQAMTHSQQKAFALELARCHVSDLSRPLFVATTLQDDVCHHPIRVTNSASDTSSTTLHTCLAHLSDAGMQSYTHFFTYVHQICLRLTHELLLQQHDDTTMRLYRASQDATVQLNRILQQQHQWTAQQQARQQELDQQHNDMLNKLHQQRRLMQEQATHMRLEHDSMREFQQDMMMSVEQREQAMSQQYQAWMEDQMVLQKNHDAELKKHLEEMMNLSKTVDDAASKIQPLLGLDRIVSLATAGVPWIASVLYFLGSMNVVWLLTLSKRHGRTRWFMFRILVLEASMELLMHWMVTERLLLDIHRQNGIRLFRSWTFRLECGLYILGWLLSFITIAHDDSIRPATTEEATVQHGMRRTEETIVRREREAWEYEERLVKLFREQQLALATQFRRVEAHNAVPIAADGPEVASAVLSLPPLYATCNQEASLRNVANSAQSQFHANRITFNAQSSEMIPSSGDAPSNDKEPLLSNNISVPHDIAVEAGQPILRNLDHGDHVTAPDRFVETEFTHAVPKVTTPPPALVTPTGLNHKKRNRDETVEIDEAGNLEHAPKRSKSVL